MAPTEITPAILLRRHRYSEGSYILTWLTQRHGKLRTAARGARRADSAFRGRVDLFYHAEILVAFSRRGDLHQLREIRLVETCDGLRRGYARLLMASYFAELLDRLIEPAHPVPDLYDLLRRATLHLAGHDPSLRSLEFFEAETCRILGFDHRHPLAALESHAGRIPASRRRVLQELPPPAPSPLSHRP